MGTRHSILVQIDNEYKIAQYGQWDGYPGGQGLKVLAFCHKMASNPGFQLKFENNLRLTQQISLEELKEAWIDVGANPNSDFVDIKTSRAFSEKYPHLSRDCGANILDLVAEGKARKINRDENFVYDSLFCEWAYVIDLDKNTLEVYSGFNEIDPPVNARFGDPAKTEGKEYKAVDMIKQYNLSNLPDIDTFLSDLEEEEEDE